MTFVPVIYLFWIGTWAQSERALHLSVNCGAVKLTVKIMLRFWERLPLLWRHRSLSSARLSPHQCDAVVNGWFYSDCRVLIHSLEVFHLDASSGLSCQHASEEAVYWCWCHLWAKPTLSLPRRFQFPVNDYVSLLRVFHLCGTKVVSINF